MTNQLMIYSDSDRCIKCYACQVACKQWHKTKAGTTSRRNVIEYTSGTFPNVQRVFYSKGCMHCEEPACAAVCPAGAITKRAEDGIVVVDRDKCIGCHYCYFACPFGIPDYDDGGMDKCDMCLSLGVDDTGRPTPPLRCHLSHPGSVLRYQRRDRSGNQREGGRASFSTCRRFGEVANLMRRGLLLKSERRYL